MNAKEKVLSYFPLDEEREVLTEVSGAMEEMRKMIREGVNMNDGLAYFAQTHAFHIIERVMAMVVDLVLFGDYGEEGSHEE